MKNLKLLVAITIAMTMTFFVMRYTKNQMPKPKEAVKQSSADPASDSSAKQKILSFNLEGLSDRGEKKWDVNGESAEAVSETRVKMSNIVAKSYGVSSEAAITADEGVYDKAKNNVTLEKNVRATIENERDGSQDFIDFSGEKKVGAKPKGAGAGGKPEMMKTVITCDGDAIFEYEKNEASFNENVKVRSDDGDMDADKMTIYLDPVVKKVNRIVAEGNVKIVRDENATYSEKASYDVNEKKAVLSGQPKVVVSQQGEAKRSLLRR